MLNAQILAGFPIWTKVEMTAQLRCQPFTVVPGYANGVVSAVLTIIESPLFSKLWPDYWSEEERGEFAEEIGHGQE